MREVNNYKNYYVDGFKVYNIEKLIEIINSDKRLEMVGMQRSLYNKGLIIEGIDIEKLYLQMLEENIEKTIKTQMNLYDYTDTVVGVVDVELKFAKIEDRCQVEFIDIRRIDEDEENAIIEAIRIEKEEELKKARERWEKMIQKEREEYEKRKEEEARTNPLSTKVEKLLEQDLKQEQKGCSARTVSVSTVKQLIKDNKKLIKKLMKLGVDMTYTYHEGGYSKKYGSYSATKIDIEFFKNGNAKKIEVERGYYEYSKEIITIHNMDELSEDVKEVLMNKFNVEKEDRTYVLACLWKFRK